jgi:hypothetical protein
MIYRHNRTSVARRVFYVVRIYPLLGNGPINIYSQQQKTVFSMGSLPRSYLEDSHSFKLRVQLWSINQRTAEAKESPLLNSLPENVYWRYLRRIAIVESSYQVKTSEGRQRRLGIEWFVMWKSTRMLQLFLANACKWPMNLFTDPSPISSH